MRYKSFNSFYVYSYSSEQKILDMNGYGESPRGGGAICFGEKAINNFLKEGKMSYIIRAHEAHSEGVSLSKGAKVSTVFSTSKDHGQGQGAMCGCILVDFDRIQVPFPCYVFEVYAHI